MGTKLRGYMTLDLFMDTWICGFQIIYNSTNLNVNKYFIGILNSWIALPMKYTNEMSKKYKWFHSTCINDVVILSTKHLYNDY